ncbi:type II toxin-antitoxin system PemK/MazF family toxin [Paenibacillus melissococcoides]|uniref:type II toxin-antitoxin system PemK/MazF family toxin n=1 Tax=Paenibacillus melissococcoides TaxID=2912268 RepID=UPI0038B352F0
MFPIDRRKLKGYTVQVNAKTEPAKQNSELIDIYKLKMWNVMDYLQELKIYDLSQWIISHDRVLSNLKKDSTAKYKRGDVLMVELGASNFKYEPSFEHPAVVLHNDYRKLLIAPCSSQKFGKGYPEVIDARPNDGGFKKDTGIQMNDVRWISKNRVATRLGTITNQLLLDKIDDYMLKFLPKYQSLFDQQHERIAELQEELADLQLKHSALEEQQQKLREVADISSAVLEFIRNDPKMYADFQVYRESREEKKTPS